MQSSQGYQRLPCRLSCPCFQPSRRCLGRQVVRPAPRDLSVPLFQGLLWDRVTQGGKMFWWSLVGGWSCLGCCTVPKSRRDLEVQVGHRDPKYRNLFHKHFYIWLTQIPLNSLLIKSSTLIIMVNEYYQGSKNLCRICMKTIEYFLKDLRILEYHIQWACKLLLATSNLTWHNRVIVWWTFTTQEYIDDNE